MHLMIRPIMPYDIPKLTENPFVLISGFVVLITAVLIAVVLSRYVAEAYKGNRKKATLCYNKNEVIFMSGDATLKVKEMLKQFAASCKKYRDFEKDVAVAKRDLSNSQKKIDIHKEKIDKLEKQVDNLMLVDLDALNKEISNLMEEKSKLGFFAIRSLSKINSQLKLKKNELVGGTHKNELIEEIEKKKKEYFVVSETEEKNNKNIRMLLKQRAREYIKYQN